MPETAERQTAQGHLGKPGIVACAFLVSDDASYAHGAAIEVSGGLVI